LRKYPLDILQNRAKRLYDLIKVVLEDQKDTNLGSEVGRNTLAKYITSLYFDETTADYLEG